MKLNNEALKKQINKQGSGVSGGITTVTDEIKETAYRQASAGIGPMSIGNYIEDMSNISENSDYAQAKRAQRTYLNPGMYAALSIAATVIAADNVKQAEKDLEYLKTARHREPVRDEHGEPIKDSNGVVKMQDSGTSIYEYQTRGIRDKDADYELIKDSSGKVSHIETTPSNGMQEVWGPSEGSSSISFTSDRPENIDMPSVDSRFAHYMDKSTDHGTNAWQEQLGVRMANASEIRDMDGGHTADFFSDPGIEKGSPFEKVSSDTGTGIAENADIPELGEGAGKVKVLDMRLNYQQVNPENTLDLSTGQQIDYSSVRTNRDGVKTVILSNGSEKKLDQVPVHNGRYIDPTTCTEKVAVSANNLGEKIGTMQDGTRIQLTVLDKGSKNALFGEASDGFMMEHAGSNRVDYVGIHHVSFLKEEKDADGISSGVAEGFGDKNFKKFIKNGKVDTAAADAAGFNVALTTARINGKEVVTGVSFIKRDTGIKTGIFSRGTARQINDNVKTGRFYEEAILGKKSMMPAAVLKRIKARKGLDQEQKEFLDKAVKSQKRAADSLKTRKWALRQLKTSIIRMTIFTPMAEDQDLQRGYQLTRKYYNGMVLAMRLERQVGFIRKPAKLAFKGAFKGAGKLVKLTQQLFMKIGPINKLVTRIKGSDFGKRIVNSKIVKAAQKMIQKAIKIGNANGVLAYMAYRSVIGTAGFFMRAPVSIFAAVTKGTKAGSTAKNVANILKKGTESVLQQGDGIGNFDDLGSVLVGLAKKGAKVAGKGTVKLAKKGGNSLGKKIFKKNWGYAKGGLKKAGKVIATPFKAVTKITGFLGRGATAIGKWIANVIKEVFHVLRVAIMWILLIFLIIILLITLMCYIGAIFSSFFGWVGKIKDFFKLGSTDEKIEQVTPDGQPTVEPLVQILQDEHNEMVSKIIKKRDKIGAQPEIIYDNGSKENYKECISALNVMAGQDYGLYGGNMCRDMMKKIYKKSHVMWVETKTIKHTEPEYEKNKDGRLVEKKGEDGKTIYKTTYTTLYYIHLNILRDTAVVSDKDAYNAVPQTAGSGTGTNPVDISSSEWLKICAKVKETANAKNPTYSKSGFMQFTVNGKNITMRRDCSGYVSACLQAAGIFSEGRLSSSSGLEGINTKDLVRHSWDGSSSVLEPGDILVYDGHAEIFAGMNGGTMMGFNWGGPHSAANPGQSGVGSHAYPKCFLRVNYSGDSKKDKKNDKDKDKDDDTDSKATIDKDGSVQATDKFTWDFLVYRCKLTKMAAAGLMGNFAVESGNNPFRIECDHLKKTWRYFGVSSRDEVDSEANVKKNLSTYDQMDKYFWEILKPSYTKITIDPDAYIVNKKGQHAPGLGLAGYTGGRTKKLLDAANDNHANWWDYDLQLNVIQSELEGSHHEAFVMANKATTVDDAAFAMAKYYEGTTTVKIADRKAHAKNFYQKYKNTKCTSDLDHIPKMKITSTGGSVGGYTVDYTPISYNSRGDEEGAYDEFRKTLDEFVKKSENGKYKQTTMYDRYHDFDESTQKLKDEKVKWEAKRQHTLTDKGGMGTGLDFLRCVVYAKHGVSLPWEYKDLKSREQEHYKVKTTKKGTEYKSWNTIKTGDLIIYQPDMDKPLYNWNTIVFSYYGGSDKYVVAYLNEDCDFGSAGDVIKIPYKKLKKTHIYKVIRVNGITKDKRYLAYPKVGFGGFKDKDDMKHMNVDVKGNKSDNKDEIECSDVELFKDMIDNKKLWVDKNAKNKEGLVIYPDAKYESYDVDGSKSGTNGVNVYYYGYTEDDFKDLLTVAIDYHNQKAALDDMVSKMGAGFDSLKAHGYLPSTFMTLAWYYSSQGTDSTLMALNNPVGLKKWWKGTDDNVYPYSTYKVDGSGYLQFDSMDECVTAWMYYVQDKTGTHSYDSSRSGVQLFGQGEGNTSLMRLKDRSCAQYLSTSEHTGAKPYMEALRQYLAVVEGYSVYGDDNNAVLDELTTICEDYTIYYYDTGIGGYDPNSDANQQKTEKGNKPQTSSEADAADKNDAENLVYANSGNAKLDCNGDGKIDLNDMSPDMLDEVFSNNKENGGLIAQLNAIYGDAFDDEGKKKRKDYTGTTGGTMDLETLNSYLDWKKNGRKTENLPGNISDKRISYNK